MTSESPVPPEHSTAGKRSADRAASPVIPDYELIRQIGRGSYGDVWLARGLTGVYRAIKVVWRDRFPNAEPFEREFKGLIKFTSMSRAGASQLALLHVGQNEGAGFFYYVMELADDVETGAVVKPGTYVPLTLSELRRRRGRLPAAECVTFGVELAQALAGLHSRGLVHRDIKPSNVILVGGMPKLADIGLVAETSDALTYVGTEGFVPPEGPGKPAADVFALGKLLYELATGLDRAEFPRLPSDLGSFPDRRRLVALNAVILRAADRDPATRLPDAGALLIELRRLERKRVAHWPWWVAIGLAAALVVGWRFGPWHQMRAAAPNAEASTIAAAPARKSIAVLPFENLNEDQQDTFFANGVHEEILTDLGNIAALHVISRTSVMQYRGTTKTVGQIARELGVEFILEGSVRRVGQKVRVTGQLIRAAADEHVWAKAYDGDLSDILALQAQVATTIAEQLKAVLTPEETKRLSAITLADPQAYEFYLRAKELRRGKLNHDDFGPNQEAEALLQKATKVDPKFALAWTELSRIHIELFFNDKKRTDLRDQAKREIDLALALAPGRAEPQAGLGEYFYYGFFDYENAAKYLRKALEFEPSDAETHRLLALVYRRLSRWRDVISEFNRAHELDPHYRPLTAMLRNAYYCVRAYPEGKALVVAQASLEPDWQENKVAVAFFEACLTSSRRPLEDYFAAMTPAERETPEVKEEQRAIAFDSGDAAQFLRLDESMRAGSSEWEDNRSMNNPAIAARVLGRDPAEILARNRAVLEGRTKGNPESDDWQGLALTCALQGDRPGAELALQRAAEMIHPDKDPLEGYVLEVTRAKTLAWLGDKAAAADLLATLVRRPGPALGIFELKFSLDWWPLRGEPRFEAILADPATNHPSY